MVVSKMLGVVVKPTRMVPGPVRGDVGCAVSVPDFHHAESGRVSGRDPLKSFEP